MKQVYKIDKDGFYLEPVLIEETDLVPDDCVEIGVPEGLYNARLVDGNFISSVTREEFESTLPPRQKTQLELMQEQIDQLILDSLMGV